MKQTDFVERLTQALDLRVRASRHSLLGQSAYSSGLQVNSPFTIQTKIPALPGPKLARRGSVKSTVKGIILHARKTLGWYAMGLIDIFSKWY